MRYPAILYEEIKVVDIVHNCRLLVGAVEISQIPLVPAFAAGTLKNEQGMLVADVYMLCLRHNMLRQCSPPLMLLLTRKKAKYAISYASIMGLSLSGEGFWGSVLQKKIFGRKMAPLSC